MEIRDEMSKLQKKLQNVEASAEKSRAPIDRPTNTCYILLRSPSWSRLSLTN